MDLDEAVDAARDGDRDAIAMLYRAVADPLLGFLRAQTARREDAEDALGEVFVSAIKDLHRFSGDFAAFKGWIYRIATNRAVDLARRRKRRPEAPLESAEAEPGSADPERDALAAMERHRLWLAVRDLPEAQRMVVTLRLTGDLSIAEIARIVGKRPNAVKALQHRAMRGIAKALSAYPGSTPERLKGQDEDETDPHPR